MLTPLPSQLGAFGVAAASVLVAPNELSGLKLWLENTSPLYQDTGTATPAVNNNDPVGHYLENSGNAFDPIQATGANRPLLQTNSQNGKRGLSFNGTAMRMATAASINLSITTGPFWVLAVVKPNTVAAGLHVIFEESVDLGISGNQLDMFISGSHRLSTTTLSANTLYLLEAWRIGTTLNLAINGVQDANSFTGINQSWNSSTLFFGSDGGGNQRLSGLFYELIIYNTAPTSQDALRGYLNYQWGIY